jgi:hypothetical protein
VPETVGAWFRGKSPDLQLRFAAYLDIRDAVVAADGLMPLSGATIWVRFIVYITFLLGDWEYG